MKNQIERRAMELGGWPISPRKDYPIEEAAPVTQEAWDALAEYKIPPLVHVTATPGLWLSKTRLIQAMRKIDPDLAHMIESLATVYLVKR
jgi:hypothetical protein